jgi:hypothetical protein
MEYPRGLRFNNFCKIHRLNNLTYARFEKFGKLEGIKNFEILKIFTVFETGIPTIC